MVLILLVLIESFIIFILVYLFQQPYINFIHLLWKVRLFQFLLLKYLLFYFLYLPQIFWYLQLLIFKCVIQLKIFFIGLFFLRFYIDILKLILNLLNLSLQWLEIINLIIFSSGVTKINLIKKCVFVEMIYWSKISVYIF